MKIEVTQEDIDAGKPGSGCWCPIALAARRATGRYVHVSYETVAIELGENSWSRHILPLETRTFIERFDNNEAVAPFAFELKGTP